MCILQLHRAWICPVSFQPLAQSYCPSGNLSYLHRSFASRCPNSSPGSASEEGCGPLGRSSQSRSLPRCGGWLWAEAGASLQGGTSCPALWGRGRPSQSPAAGLPVTEMAAWFPRVPSTSLPDSCSAFLMHLCAARGQPVQQPPPNVWQVSIRK